MLNKQKLFAKNDSMKSMYVGRKSSMMLDLKKLQAPSKRKDQQPQSSKSHRRRENIINQHPKGIIKRPSSQSSLEQLSQPGVPGIEEYEEIGCSKEMQMIIDKVRRENRQFERIHQDEERVIMGKPPLRRHRVRRIFRTSKVEGASYSPSQLATGVMTPSEKPLVKSYA